MAEWRLQSAKLRDTCKFLQDEPEFLLTQLSLRLAHHALAKLRKLPSNRIVD
jgi:hypothetical protein